MVVCIIKCCSELHPCPTSQAFLESRACPMGSPCSHSLEDSSQEVTGDAPHPLVLRHYHLVVSVGMCHVSEVQCSRQ